MSEKNRNKKFLVLGIIFLSGITAILILSRLDHSFGTLPYFYPTEVVQKNVDGQILADTIWHTIPEFDFIDQDGNKLDRSYMDGHVSVVDFFFTTCTTICPKMTRQMKGLVWNLDEKYFEEVRFLSITVDPEFDTPEVLKKYTQTQESIDPRWSFATGKKEDIYNLGVQGFKLTTQEDLQLAGNFLHSEKMVLVDAEGHIRGYYDGTDPIAVRDLEEDIKMLVGTQRRMKK